MTISLRPPKRLRSRFVKRLLVGLKKVEAGLIDGIVLEQRNADEKEDRKKIRKAIRVYFKEDIFFIHKFPTKEKGKARWLVARKEKVRGPQDVEGQRERLREILDEVDQCGRFYVRGTRKVPL